MKATIVAISVNFSNARKVCNLIQEQVFDTYQDLRNYLTIHLEIEFNIFTPNYRNADTVIDFDNYPSDFDEVIYNAENKFKDLIEDVLKRIEADIDYRFTDEAIIEDIEANDYEFLSNGKGY